MLSTNDFAQRVWVSLEDIRERMAVLETEFGHMRGHLEHLEEDLQGHIEGHRSSTDGSCRRHREEGPANDASITIRLSRRTLGGGGLLGGGIAGPCGGGGQGAGLVVIWGLLYLGAAHG